MKNLHDLYLPIKLLCLQGTSSIHWDQNSNVSATNVDIVEKTTAFTEKQITTVNCMVLISYCAHQPLAVAILNSIYLRAWYHQNIV